MNKVATRIGKTTWCPVDVESETFAEIAALSPAPIPGKCIWFGATRDGNNPPRLDAAIGFAPAGTHGVWVHVVLARKGIEGHRALYDLLQMFDWVYRDDDVSFAIDLRNDEATRQMQKIMRRAIETARIFTRPGHAKLIPAPGAEA